MNLYKVKKSRKKHQKEKFSISSGLFIMAKNLKNNFIAYYLLLANASPRKLSPYYHTFIYTSIRKIAKLLIGIKKAAARIKFKLPGINRDQFINYLPRISKRGISAVVIIAVISAQVINVGAFEAHVVNVTATIVNDIPLIAPNGGEFCNTDGANITITSPLTGTSTLVYTTDGTDPVCPGIDYSQISFTLFQSATVKARTCHDYKQSAVRSRTFSVESQFCDNITPPPTSSTETCDGADNDLNGTIDDVYETRLATSTPNLTRLDDLTNVTASTTISDDIYAEQTAASATARYIYLNWVFPQIATTSLIASSTLYLEHSENNASTSIEWWNGSSFQQVCNPPEQGSDTADSCNLNSFITSASLAGNIALRLVIDRLSGTATENLDWAELDIQYIEPVNCSLLSCGNGNIDSGETCDDGNLINQDGCSSTCQIEPAASCVKINEVYYDVDSTHGTESDNEWVELYNACGYAANLVAWTIHGNTSATTTMPNLNLVSHGFAVLAQASTTWAFWNIPAEAQKIELGNSIGGGMSNSADRVILKDNNGIIVDQMSYGTDVTVFNLPEPASASTKGRSIARIVKGIDTDTAADWAYLANPNPGTNPHPRINPSIIIENPPAINQSFNSPADPLINDVQEPLNPAAASTSDSVSEEPAAEPNQPAAEPSVNEAISPDQEILDQENIESDDEAADAADTAGAENQGEASDLISDPEPAITEPAPEPTPVQEQPTIEAPKEPAIEPVDTPADSGSNSKTATL